MKHLAIAAASTLSFLSIAAADFVGIAVNEAEIGGNCVVDVYATYTDPLDRLISLSSNISIDGGFGSLIHDDLFGGSWAPQLTIDATIDSFVTIGGEANFLNTTLDGGGWGVVGWNQIDIPPGAAWQNVSYGPESQAQPVNLANLRGQSTWSGEAIRVMRLVFVSPPPPGKLFTFSGTAIGNSGIGTPVQYDRFSFSAALCAVPSPSALALLGIAALVDRRRRT